VNPSPKNIQASIHQRLLNVSKQSGRAFNDVAMYYAIERFLYRLSRSPHAEQFVLKGGLLLRVWNTPATRVTRDIDLLGKLDNDPAHIRMVVGDLCRVAVDDDGLSFDAESVTTERIAEDADYEGVRALFRGRFGKMPLAMQIDFGFSDVVTPNPEPITYPSLLDHPPAEMLAYNRETVIAEKYEAMVKLGELNSRMKDFFDIFVLAQNYGFEGETLSHAIAQTFAQRGTTVESDPACFGDAFAGSAVKIQQWKGFLKTNRVDQAPPQFTEVVVFVASFIQPVTAALAANQTFTAQWPAGGQWERESM
jgi:hypothetical protein